MTRNIIVLGTALILASTAAQAASPKEERIGVGIGATVGAVAGGPVGAILGAAIGARFGDNYHQKNEQIDGLSASLERSQQRTNELQRTVAELNRDISVIDSDLRRLQSQARPELLSLLQAGIEMDLLFRTDEHVLMDGTQSRVGQLAATLASMPDVQVQLDGFADERGDENYNRELSERRAKTIRQLLIDNGVDASRIKIAAHGEAPASDTHPDSYALDRKVSLTLFISDSPAFAANP
jgi:outer membrane protein OmpA-like peptidoglycan-associated protein